MAPRLPHGGTKVVLRTPSWCPPYIILVRLDIILVCPGHLLDVPTTPSSFAHDTILVPPGHHLGAPRAPSVCTDGTIVLHQLRGVHHFPLPPKELTRHLPLCFKQRFQWLSRLPVFSWHPDFHTEAPMWCSVHRLGVPRTPS